MKGIILPFFFTLISINAQVNMKVPLGVPLNTPLADGSYTMTDLDGQGQDFTMNIASISGYAPPLVELDNSTNLYQRNATVTISINNPLYTFDITLWNYQNLLVTETLTIDALPANSNILISQYNIYPAHCTQMAEVNGTPMPGTLPAVNSIGWGQTPTSGNYTAPIVMTTVSPCYSYEISYEMNNITQFSWSVINTSSSKEGFIINDIEVKPIPLPVILDVYQIDCRKLTWSTISEINADYFELEVSNDANTWTSTGLRTNASGTSSSYHHYGITLTPEILGHSYYRIVQYDYNGEKDVFPTLPLFCNRERKIIAVYQVDGKLLGTKIPSQQGIFLIVYSDGKVKRLVNTNPSF